MSETTDAWSLSSSPLTEGSFCAGCCGATGFTLGRGALKSFISQRRSPNLFAWSIVPSSRLIASFAVNKSGHEIVACRLCRVPITLLVPLISDEREIWPRMLCEHQAEAVVKTISAWRSVVHGLAFLVPRDGAGLSVHQSFSVWCARGNHSFAYLLEIFQKHLLCGGLINGLISDEKSTSETIVKEYLHRRILCTGRMGTT